MNAHTIQTPEQHRSRLDVSPVLETGSPTPLSTYWMPLPELITHWTDVDTLLLPAPVAPLLTAIGHALFALLRETRALRLYTLAWQKQQGYAPAAAISGCYAQTVRHLHEAAHHGVERHAPSIPCCRPTWNRLPWNAPGDFRASPGPSRNAYGH